jgi:flagellar hook-length control protein FliK
MTPTPKADLQHNALRLGQRLPKPFNLRAATTGFPDVLASLQQNTDHTKPAHQVEALAAATPGEELDERENRKAETEAEQPHRMMEPALASVAILMQRAAEHDEPRETPGNEPSSGGMPMPDQAASAATPQQSKHRASSTGGSRPPETMSRPGATPQPAADNAKVAASPKPASQAPTVPVRAEAVKAEEPAAEPAAPPARDVSAHANRSTSPKVSSENLPPAEVTVTKVTTAMPAGGNAASAFAERLTAVLQKEVGPPQTGAAIAPGKPVLDPRPPVVRSLQIELHPEALGRVKIDMVLRGNALMVRLEPATKAAEEVLMRDRDEVHKLLSKAGYDVADTTIAIAVRPAPPPSSAADSGSPEARQQPATGSSNPWQGTTRNDQHSNSPHHPEARSQRASSPAPQNPAEVAEGPAGSARSGGVFI